MDYNNTIICMFFTTYKLLNMDFKALYNIISIIRNLLFIIRFFIWIPWLLIGIVLITVKKFSKYKKLGKWLVLILPVWFLASLVVIYWYRFYAEHIEEPDDYNSWKHECEYVNHQLNCWSYDCSIEWYYLNHDLCRH